MIEKWVQKSHVGLCKVTGHASVCDNRGGSFIINQSTLPILQQGALYHSISCQRHGGRYMCIYVSSCLRPSPPPCLGKITSPQNIDQTYSKKLSKIDQKSVPKALLEGSWRLLGGSWEALGGLLGVSWGYLGPKSQQVTEKLVRWTPLDPPTWNQNPTKVIIKSIKKLRIC